MDFERIMLANKEMHLTPIKGKDYAEVPQRVKGFRFLYPDGTIETEMISNDNGVCIFKAYAKDAEGRVLSTGTAYEKENSTYINKTSYIENCETSAVGRCLGFLGLGIDTSIASAEEVLNAKEQQKKDTGKDTKDTKKDTKEPPTQAPTPTPAPAEPPAQAPTQAPTESPEAIKKRVNDYINSCNMTPDAIAIVCRQYRVNAIADMTWQQCNHYINYVKSKGGNI